MIKFDVNKTVFDVKHFLMDLQNRICAALAQEDGEQSFQEDCWQHEKGGGGQTRILREGQVFEQAGVNFSHVQGDQLPPSAMAARPELIGCQFQATGVSLVIHPTNPSGGSSYTYQYPIL